MNIRGAWKIADSRRSLILIVAPSCLLAVSLVGNIQQSIVIRRQHKRLVILEREDATRVKADADRTEARRKKNAEWAAADARLQQLYREIDGLARINDHLNAEQSRHRSTPVKDDTSREADNLP